VQAQERADAEAFPPMIIGGLIEAPMPASAKAGAWYFRR
jgi:hypothetical protein